MCSTNKEVRLPIPIGHVCNVEVVCSGAAMAIRLQAARATEEVFAQVVSDGVWS